MAELPPPVGGTLDGDVGDLQMAPGQRTTEGVGMAVGLVILAKKA